MVNDYGSLEFQTVELMNQDIPNLPTGCIELFQCNILRVKVSFYESLICNG